MNPPGGSGGVPPGIDTAPEEGATVHAPEPAEAPSTGDPAIDDALQGLHDLQFSPLAEHHDRLAQVHEALHVALERSDDEPGAG